MSLAAGLAVVAATTIPAPAQTEEFIAGAGRATSQVLAVVPNYGALPISIMAGKAAATYQTTAGRAEAATIDLGIIGIILTLSICGGDPIAHNEDLPQPTQADSNDGQPHESRSDDIPVGGGASAGVEEAAARPNAFGSATATTATLLDLPGVLTVGSGSAHADTELVPGQQRRATSSVELGSIKLADLDGVGPVPALLELGGLRWEAQQISTGPPGTPPDEATGSFSFGSAKILGVPQSAGGIDALNMVVGQLSSLFRPFLFSIEMPTVVKHQSGEVEVTPLRIVISGGEAFVGLVAPLLNNPSVLQLKKGVRDLLIANCGPGIKGTQIDALRNGADIIASVILAGLEGEGGIDIELGGVSAYTEAKKFANPFGSGGSGSFAPAAPAPSQTATPAPTPGFTSAPSAAPPAPGVAAPSPAAPSNPAVETIGDERCISTHVKNWPGCSTGRAGLALLLAAIATGALIAGDIARSRRRRARSTEAPA